MKFLPSRSSQLLVRVVGTIAAAVVLGGQAREEEQRGSTSAVVDEIRRLGLGETSQVMDHAFFLSDVAGPRLTGSPAFRQAGEWALARLRDFGLDVDREPFVYGRSWSEQRFTIRLLEPQAATLIGTAVPWSASTPGALDLQSSFHEDSGATFNVVAEKADLVSHGGDSATGSFVHTLTLTDVASGWTECVALVVRDGALVAAAREQLRQTMPIPLRGFDTDTRRVHERDGSGLLPGTWHPVHAVLPYSTDPLLNAGGRHSGKRAAVRKPESRRADGDNPASTALMGVFARGTSMPLPQSQWHRRIELDPAVQTPGEALPIVSRLLAET